MNFDSLKAILLPLLQNGGTLPENIGENDAEIFSDSSIFPSSQEFDDIEKAISDIFISCDKNGNGEIDADEIQSLSTGLSAMTGFSETFLGALIGEESGDDRLNALEEELSQMQADNPMQIDFTKEPTIEDIQENENLLTQIINDDEIISPELKEEREETYSLLSEIQDKIHQLEDKTDLSDAEKIELAELSTQASELSEKLKENETDILENCSDETKLAISDLNKLKELYSLAEGGGKGIVQTDNNQNTIDTADTSVQPDTTSGTQPNISSTGSNTGNYQSYNSSNVVENNSSKSYSNMTLDELKSELSTEQNTLNENKEELKNILNGTNEKLSAAKEDINTKRDELNKLLETVSPELAKELSDVQTKKDDKQSEIDNKKTEIFDKESSINECQRNFDNAKSAVTNQENIVSNLESALSSAKDEDKEQIESSLAAAKTELETLKSQRDEAEKKLEEEKEDLAVLKEELTNLEAELEEIQEEENAVNAKIDELNNAEISAAKEELQTAEKNYETTKSSLETAANDKISKSESKITEIEAAITEKANSAQRSKYSTSTLEGKYTLNGVEYNSLVDGSELKSLSNEIIDGGAGTGFGHPDKCLSFAYSYGQWIDNSTNTPKNGTAGNYPDAGAYTQVTGSKEDVLTTIKEELDSGNPVVLQVNGNKAGTSRHYVTVVGYRSDAGSTLEEKDLLIIDTYDGLIEGMGDNGTRFMVTGEACHKKYSGYQIYVRK